MRRPGFDEHLGGGAPDHHDPIDLLLVAEAVDVLADRLEHRPLADRAEHVVGVDVLDVAAVEGRRHRPDVAEGVGDLLDVPAGVEHAGPLGGHVGIVGERDPTRRTRGRPTRRSGRSRGSAALRSSVRLPRRIVPISASEPIGSASPRLTSSTPAMRVDDTAPRPTVRTPRRPSAGAHRRRRRWVHKPGSTSTPARTMPR